MSVTFERLSGGPKEVSRNGLIGPSSKQQDSEQADEHHSPILTKTCVAFAQIDFSTPGKRGGLNRSTQHSAQAHLALKAKAKIARKVK
jgi:hypothetical protein